MTTVEPIVEDLEDTLLVEPLEDIATQLQEVERSFGAIEVLCSNPHWTMERRWRIMEFAGVAMIALDKIIKMGE